MKRYIFIDKTASTTRSSFRTFPKIETRGLSLKDFKQNICIQKTKTKNTKKPITRRVQERSSSVRLRWTYGGKCLFSCGSCVTKSFFFSDTMYEEIFKPHGNKKRICIFPQQSNTFITSDHDKFDEPCPISSIKRDVGYITFYSYLGGTGDLKPTDS